MSDANAQAKKDKRELGHLRDKTSISMAATASGTLAGFGVTILTLIVSLSPRGSSPQALLLLLEILGVAIVFLLMSIDFYLIASWKEDVYERFGTLGSLLYGVGVSLLIVAVALMMVVLVTLTVVSYTILVLTFAGSMVHYALRWKYTKGDPYRAMRLIGRAAIFIINATGIALVYMIERGCF